MTKNTLDAAIRKHSVLHNKRHSVSRALGSDIVDAIGKLAIHSPYEAVVEFIANSYDADATQVTVEYDPEKNTMNIFDNGSGMVPEDLKAFYRLGDSPKKIKPISPHGRKRIGELGVATILLNYLAKEYTLVTEKGGVQTTVEEKFEKKLNARKKIPFMTSRTEKKKHGTAIYMRNLNITSDNEFSIEKLKRTIQWDMPTLPDFNVRVSGEELVAKPLLNATEFRIDETVQGLGRVHGSVYYTAKPVKAPVAGFHIYIHGRRHGDPNTFINLHKIKYNLKDHIAATIHADGLRKAILFNRGILREDDPSYIKLKKLVTNALHKIKRYASSNKQHNRAEKILAQKEKILANIKNKCISSGVEYVGRDTAIELSDKLQDSAFGAYLKKENKIVINQFHSSLAITPSTKIQHYEMALANAVVSTLAAAKGKSRHRAGLEHFMNECAGLWEKINAVEEDKKQAQKHRVYPTIVYDIRDMTKNFRMNLRSIHYMLNGGLLSNKNGGVLGREIIDARKKTEGMLALCDLVPERYNIKQLDKILSGAEKSAKPFIKNFGNGTPCYFIEKICAKEVKKIIGSSKQLRADNASSVVAKSLQKLASRYFSLPDLARSSDISISDVSKVFDYSKRACLKIGKVCEDGVRFNYKDFVSAYQHMRVNADG